MKVAGKKWFKALCVGLCTLTLVGGLTACGSKTGEKGTKTEEKGSETTAETSKQGGTVMLYSSMQEDQLIAIKEAFTKKYPDIKMEYYFAGTSKVITKIATEAQSGQLGADVIWVGDPADYVSFRNQDILESYVSPEAAAIDPAYVDPDGYYTGARLINMGIAYNNQLVTPEEAPKTWKDLLDPKWNDQIVMTDPGSSGTSKYWRNAIMTHPDYGQEFIQQLKDNGAYLESGTTATHNQLAASAYKVGVCLDYVTANLANEGSPITFVFPEDTVSIFSPIGLVKDAKNKENAKILYDFILSKEGQEVLVANNLISVRNDIEQPNIDAEAMKANSMKADLKTMVEKDSENGEIFDKIFGL